MRDDATSNTATKKQITVIVPIYNEEEVIPLFYRELKKVAEPLPYGMSLLFVNDGSTDQSEERVRELMARDPHVAYLAFSRNFGKEAATSAGIHTAEGDAAILIDADLQHPVDLIPEFLAAWEGGASIVMGRREESVSDNALKRMGSRLFYKILDLISDVQLTPNATDFRLLDRAVIAEFNRFTERERVTRNLIDWLGFHTVVIPFRARERAGGTAQYSMRKLLRLALVGLTSNSLLPLRLAGYLGAFITAFSIPLGIIMFIDHYVYSMGFNFSGSVMLGALLLFLIGIVLICMGLLAFYIGHIFEEARGRPMYVISKRVNI
jgi:polyisoprenyl-phosphate glycosyltransferase